MVSSGGYGLWTETDGLLGSDEVPIAQGKGYLSSVTLLESPLTQDRMIRKGETEEAKYLRVSTYQVLL